MSCPPRPSSLCLPASTCWGESSSFPCFWTGMRHLLSSTSTISTNGPNFHMTAQIRSTQQAGRGAICTRWTCGSGSLGGASLSLGTLRWQTKRSVKLSSRQTVIGVLLRRASAHCTEGCKMTWRWRKQGVQRYATFIPYLSDNQKDKLGISLICSDQVWDTQTL